MSIGLWTYSFAPGDSVHSLLEVRWDAEKMTTGMFLRGLRWSTLKPDSFGRLRSRMIISGRKCTPSSIAIGLFHARFLLEVGLYVAISG
jgi:hypothetical protein